VAIKKVTFYYKITR